MMTKEWFLLLGFLLVGTVALPFLRGHRWVLVFWSPIVVLDFLILRQIFGILPHNVGHTPDSGFVGMAVGFYLLFALPLIIAAAVSLMVAGFAFPRKIAWNLPGVIGGLSTSAFAVFALTELQTPRTTITVTDEDGIPAPNLPVHFSVFEFGSTRSLSTKTTDKKGIVTMHLPPEEWSATIDSDNKMQSSVGVGRLVDNDSDPNSRALRRWWWNKEWGTTRPQLVLDGHFSEQHRFDLRLRKPNEVVSPWMAIELHRLLLEVLSDGKHASALREMCDNLESFNELELLGQIAAKNQTLSGNVAQVLVHDADVIKGFRAGLLVKEGKRSDNSNWPYEYSVLCRWLGFDEDPQSIKDTAPKLHERLQQITDKLLTTAEPLWPKHGPVVFSEFGKLVKPAVPRLLRAMEIADERYIATFWDTLERSKPDVDQVRPFFQSNNPFVAAAAIYAVRDKLTSEDAKNALEKLRAISAPDMSRIPPDPTTTQEPLFREQLNAIWLQQRLDELIPAISARLKPTE